MRKRTGRQLVIGLLIAVLCSCVCVVVFAIAWLAVKPLLSPPKGGLSQSAAESSAAGEAYSTTPVRVIFARPGRFSQFEGASKTVRPDTWVWAVSFSGTFLADSCGPEPTQPDQTVKCPPPGISAPQHTKLVLIDYFSGRLIWASAPSPIPYRRIGCGR